MVVLSVVRFGREMIYQLRGCSKYVGREEKRKTTELDVDPSFVLRSLQATDGVAEGGSRFSGTRS